MRERQSPKGHPATHTTANKPLNNPRASIRRRFPCDSERGLSRQMALKSELHLRASPPSLPPH